MKQKLNVMQNVVIISQEQFNNINSKLEQILSKVSDQKPPENEWLSAKETMEMLNIGQTTLWTYRKEGKIAASKINRKLYFNRKDILKLLEFNTS